MTWDLKDEDMRASIISAVAPPSVLTDLLANDMWASTFSVWATEQGWAKGVYEPSRLFELWRDYRGGTAWETVRDKYVVDGNPMSLEWPSAVKDAFGRAATGESEPRAALAQLWGYSAERLERYVTEFLADIKEIQSSAASEPTVVAFSREGIDQAMVDRVNGANVKDLQPKQLVNGWLKGDLLLLGEGHPASYLAYAKDGGVEVQVWMWDKGGAFGRGELRWTSVTGNTLIDSDQLAGIGAAVARFSQKKLRPLNSV